MLKFSNKTFYNRHNHELGKYIYEKDSLHILNVKSKHKFFSESTEKIYLDLDSDKHLSELNLDKKFDRILITDVIENHEDVYGLLSAVNKLLNKDGKLIISSINTKYISIFKFLELVKLKDSNKSNSYIHLKKINNITSGIGLEYQKFYTKQLFPFSLFSIGNLLNKVLESILFTFNFGIKTYMIFRPVQSNSTIHSKSIIIPAKNEEGNLYELISRIPKIPNTEIIFSYGESKDKTLAVMKDIIKSNNDFNFKLVSQSQNGKANAVWEALEVVDNEVIAILDADISVEPETLIDFFEIIDKNRADFVNGTRLIYDMERNSMRFLNKLGNRFFQFFIRKIIKEPLTDSLCGTKVFKKSYINDLLLWQSVFGINDPFGDFDMIFSAAYSGQKILELPVNYKERKYGTTQISRFSDGFRLLFYLASSFFEFNTSRNSQF